MLLQNICTIPSYIIKFVTVGSNNIRKWQKKSATRGFSGRCLIWHTLVNMSKFNTLLFYFTGGSVTLRLENTSNRTGTHLLQTHHTLQWMEEYFKNNCDSMPDQDCRHLPSCLTRNDIYKNCSMDLEAVGNVVCSKAQFHRMWNLYFPNVTIPKVTNFLHNYICDYFNEF